MMPVTDCHRCGTLVAYDAQLAEPRCTPCALAERDAALAVLRALVAADDALTLAYTGDGRRDPLSAEVAHECAAAEGAFQAALAAARRLLAGQP